MFGGCFCQAGQTGLANAILVPGDHPTIQAAIDAAGNGDVIVIEAGMYWPTATIDTLGKAVTLSGAVDRQGLPATIIDGRGNTGVVQCVSHGVRFQNLKMTNGWVDGADAGLLLAAWGEYP